MSGKYGLPRVFSAFEVAFGIGPIDAEQVDELPTPESPELAALRRGVERRDPRVLKS